MQRIKTWILCLLCLCSTSLLAQTPSGTLKGRIFDTEGEPLTGATIQVKNTSRGTVTDTEGRFLLQGLKKGDVLVCSFVGMKSQQIVFGSKEYIEIVMQDDTEMLEGVVVRAKANINEIDLRAKSGVVQEVDVKRIAQKPTINMGLALQGSLPGLTVINTGALGEAPQIRIRGNSSLRRGNFTNEPLYVMDGQVISAETFYNLNPNDIKEIRVLKDAAACALYGVKAANGVLEMTSQRGSAGKISVTYGMSMGITTRGRRGIAMMNSEEKLELERLLQNVETPGYRYSADYYNKYYPNDPRLPQLIAEGQAKLDSLKRINTDWFNVLLRNNLYQKHDLSVRGGSEQTTYYISANYTAQGGRIPGNDKHRMGMMLNLDQKIADLGYLLLSINGGYTRTETPNGTSSDPASLIYDLNPYEQKTGKLISFPGKTFDDLMHQYSAQNSDKEAGISCSVNLSPLKGLELSAVAGLNFSLFEGQQFTPSTAYSETHSGVPPIERGIYSKNKSTTTNISTNVRATYQRTIAEKHDLTLGVNSDFYFYDLDNVSMRGYGVGELNSAAAINQDIKGNRKPYVNGDRDRNAQVGIGIVSGYTYDNTYDLYATAKWDASSVLPADKRWNSAWAVGASWTPTHMEKLKGNRLLTDLNIRTSYGYTANLNGVSIAQTVASFSYNAKGYENHRILSLLSLYNTDLKPEITKTIDLGVTIELFKRINIQLNVYNRRTEEALLDVPIPTSSGFSILKRNIGVLQNRGIETSLRAQLFRNADWDIVLGGNIAYNANKVLDLYFTDKIYTSESSLVPDYEVGKSYDMLYGPESLGIDPLTGYYTFRLPYGGEKSATQPLKQDDVVALGHLTPPFSGSLNFSLSYKEFDLFADFYYALGGVRPLNYSYVRNKDHANKNAVAGQTENMWFKVGDENKIYPTPFYTSGTAESNIALYANSSTIGSSNFLRLSMLTLRYRIPSKLLKRFLPMVEYGNIALQGSNLFTWTGYKESDPESGRLAGTLQPVYTLHLNLTF